MSMPRVSLDGRRIGDWKAFHAECRTAFGFPECYGGNMDAWIDCMSGMRDDDGMTKFVLGADERLEIEVLHVQVLRLKAPEILEALEDCVAEVNERCAEHGEKPSLTLRLH